MSASDKPVGSGKQNRTQLTSQRRRARQPLSAAQEAKRLQAKIDAGTRIIADRSKQAPNNSYDPPTFYEDTEFACLDCGKQETWTARQ